MKSFVWSLRSTIVLAVVLYSYLWLFVEVLPTYVRIEVEAQERAKAEKVAAAEAAYRERVTQLKVLGMVISGG